MASTSLETAPSTSDISTMARKEKSGYDQLPKEMHEMKIRDEKVNNHDEKVNFLFELICFFLLHKQFPNFFSQYYAIIYMYEQFFFIFMYLFNILYRPCTGFNTIKSLRSCKIFETTKTEIVKLLV